MQELRLSEFGNSEETIMISKQVQSHLTTHWYTLQANNTVALSEPTVPKMMPALNKPARSVAKARITIIEPQILANRLVIR